MFRAFKAMLNPYYCQYLVLREIRRTLRVNMAIRVIKTTIIKATIVKATIVRGITIKAITTRGTTTRVTIVKATTTRGSIDRVITARGIIFRVNMLIRIIVKATTIRILLQVRAIRIKAIQIKVTAVIANLYRLGCLPSAAGVSEPTVQSVSNPTYELLPATSIQSDTQPVWT